ncbi:MAG: hypothetical protein JXJ20_10755 [Anaerolineae bacterium]|jgi:hypothetical protein|nr:hypothetical protein [Anaerolineae bacterium]
MKIQRAWLLVTVATLSMTGTALADGPDDAPLQAVEQFVQGVFDGDYDAALDLMCEDDRQNLGDTDLDFDALSEQVQSLDLMVNLNDLDYKIIQRGESWAEVGITGEVAVQVQGQTDITILSPQMLQIEMLWAITEDDAWKVCSAVPDDMVQAIAPEEIAQLFIGNAFAGNFEGSLALVCTAQQETLSEAQFDMMFGDFRAQNIALDLSGVVFETVDQTDEEAVVELSGDILMSWQDRPRPIPIDVERLGLGPVHLIFEDGWKICETAPVES